MSSILQTLEIILELILKQKKRVINLRDRIQYEHLNQNQ